VVSEKYSISQAPPPVATNASDATDSKAGDLGIGKLLANVDDGHSCSNGDWTCDSCEGVLPTRLRFAGVGVSAFAARFVVVASLAAAAAA
jgi:hypothetical protein